MYGGTRGGRLALFPYDAVAGLTRSGVSDLYRSAGARLHPTRRVPHEAYAEHDALDEVTPCWPLMLPWSVLTLIRSLSVGPLPGGPERSLAEARGDARRSFQQPFEGRGRSLQVHGPILEAPSKTTVKVACPIAT